MIAGANMVLADGTLVEFKLSKRRVTMTEQRFERRKKNLVDITTGEVLQFPSINKCKAESRKMQQANGGLGQGYVRVKR